ncbi:hypothetical protein QL285_059510 [Trifolium repens]|jgi:hypothetical protein|nr:hypothetical protein QL285_059510 [Trifolium repens]
MVGGGAMSGVWPSAPLSGDTSFVHGEVLAADLELGCFASWVALLSSLTCLGLLVVVVCFASCCWIYFLELFKVSLRCFYVCFHVVSGCVVV